jgi:hypothetical protein
VDSSEVDDDDEDDEDDRVAVADPLNLTRRTMLAAVASGVPVDHEFDTALDLPSFHAVRDCVESLVSVATYRTVVEARESSVQI